MKNNIIYFDKKTGKILTMDEAKEEWERAKAERRSVSWGRNYPVNLVIENGYVKERILTTVAEKMKKNTEGKAKQQDSMEQQEEVVTTKRLDSLLAPPNVPAPEPLVYEPMNSDLIVDSIIDEVKSDVNAKEKMRDAIIDEIIAGVRADEQKRDEVLEEIIQAVIAEDEARKAEQARLSGETYTVNDILREAEAYPSVDSAQYDVDSIINEYSSQTKPRFIDVTQSILQPELDNGRNSTLRPQEEVKTLDPSDPEYAIEMVHKAQAQKKDPRYSSLVTSSVIEGEIVDFERTGKKKGIKYDALAKGLVALASVAILFSGVKAAVNVIDNVSSNITYNTAVSQMQSAYEASSDFVNKNKIVLEGTYDINGWPAYWIDTKGVAEDILTMPDSSYIGSLYLAYCQMGNDRANGQYHNWDDTIGHISNLVDETHPTALLTTAGCRTFEEFLIQAGYINPDTNEPSSELFEAAGRNAIIEFVNNMQNQEVGGR